MGRIRNALVANAHWMWIVGAMGMMVLAAVSGAVFWNSLRMEQSRQEIEQLRNRSLEAIVSAKSVENEMIDAQRAARGYMLTRGGIEYDERRFAPSREISRLRSLVRGDVGQETRVEQLAVMASAQQSRIADMVARSTGGDWNAGFESARSGIGERSLGEAREMVAQTVRGERLNLDGLTATAAAMGRDSETYTYAIGIMGLLVLVVGGTAVMISVSSNWRERMGEVQRRLDDEMRLNERRMRIAQEATGAGTWEIDGSGSLRWSPEMFRLYGRDPKLGEPGPADWRDVVHPDDAAALPWTSGHAPSSSFEETFRIAGGGGGWRWIASRGFSFVDGDEVRMVGMDVDVTEQVSNREELARLNDLLSREAESSRRDKEMVFETSLDILATMSRDGLVSSANPAWSEVLGLDPQDLVGGRMEDILAEGSSWTPEKGSFSTGMVAGDGLVRMIEWSTALGSDGSVVAAGRDVTRQREDEKRLRMAEEAVRQMQKIETIGQMTGGVAHDFNNMLTPIVGFLDLLQRRHSDDAKSARMINMAMQSADKAKTLVSKLLSFARRQQLEYRVVDAAALVRGMEDLVGKAVSSSGVELEVSSDEGLSCVRLDPNQFEMVLMNLAVNARDAMVEGGRIQVGVVRRMVSPEDVGPVAEGEYVVVSVRDSGIGMDEETLARAVEPFYSTKGIGKGTGLGLSMAHGMAAQSGGALVLESEIGVGTTASIWLPRVCDEMLVAGGEDEERVEHGVTRRMRILLVDDEDLVRRSIEQMLVGQGHEVVTACSGAEALSKIASMDDIDVLVTDYLMPSMTGGELVGKARDIHPGLPALIVSGYTNVPDQNAGVDAVRLAKPFTAARLQDALERALPAPEGVGNVIDIRRRSELQA